MIHLFGISIRMQPAEMASSDNGTENSLIEINKK
jgi:hypothetical protein